MQLAAISRLSAYTPPPPAVIATGYGASYPTYYFYPPAGSPWAQILAAWDGSPGSLINVPALGIANMQPMVQALQNSGYDNIGDYLSSATGVSDTGYSGYEVLDNIFTIVLPYIYFWTPDANGNLVASKTLYDQPESLGLEVTQAFFAVMGGEIVGAAAAAGAAAGAAGGTGAASLTSTDVATIYGDAGYSGADLTGATVAPSTAAGGTGAASLSSADTSTILGDQGYTDTDLSSTSVSSTTTATGTTAPDDLPGTATASTGGDTTLQTTLPDTDYVPPDPGPLNVDLPQPELPADDQAALDAGANGSTLSIPPGVSQAGQLASAVNSIGKLIGNLFGTVTGTNANGATSTNPGGAIDSTAAGSIGGLAIIALGIFLLIDR